MRGGTLLLLNGSCKHTADTMPRAFINWTALEGREDKCDGNSTEHKMDKRRKWGGVSLPNKSTL